MEKKVKILGIEKMFCSICEEEHNVELIEEEREIEIKGKKVKHKEKMYRCNKYTKENTFETGEMWNENLISSYDAYRQQNNLLTSKEIKQIRNKYKITQLEMAKLLGVGDVTVTRYETKQIQDEAHDKIMRLIDENALIALEYLENNKEKFQKGERYETIKNNIKTVIFKETLSYLNKQEIEAKYVDYLEKNIENGNNELKIKTVETVINYISQNYPNLYKVKLMKLLWYIDSIAYKENEKSLTGLVYTHKKMGAVPIAYDELLKLPSIKVEEEVMDKENYSVCYHILPNESYKLKVNLTDKEKEICDRVINKFKDFSTKELVDYMHNEKAYTDTKPNEVIDFSYAKFVEI
mgnify:CR=1 FL=1